MNKLESIMPDIFQATQALTNHDGQTAFEILRRLELEDPHIVQEFAELAYIYGLTQYELGNFSDAIDLFIYALSWESHDEIVQFYTGNCFLKLRKLKNARTCFENVLMIRKFFPEAQNNLSITICSLMQGYIKRSDWERIDWYINPNLDFDVEDSEACFEIPIFINNRDRVGCLSKLLDWLLKSGYRRIYILDQDSTYPPLLEFYETFRQDPRVHVLRMENLGFQAIWKSKILEDLDIRTPYVYTDSDILPIGEKNMVQELIRTLKKYPLVKKVAAKVDITGIIVANAEQIEISNAENYAPNRQVAPNEFFRPRDTTFAVYRDARHYQILYSIHRSDLQIRHLPWHYDINNLPEDEKYYAVHADRSSNFSIYVRSKMEF